MHQIKNYFIRTVAGFFVLASIYACEDKKKANDEVQDADKTEMMEEEHQMDPIEGELMKDDSSQMDLDKFKKNKEDNN